MNDELEFERTKDYLKSKLADYLRQKGINLSKNFTCLNPSHPDHHPSMSFNPKTNQAHCFACNVTYDIFDVIGLDYHLNSFKEQYAKACEIFLNRLSNLTKPTKTYENINIIGTPAVFGAARLNGQNANLKSENQTFDSPVVKGVGQYVRKENNLNSSAFTPINDENSGVRSLSQGAAVFGVSQRNSYYESYNTRIISQPVQPVKKDEGPKNLREYLKFCAQNVNQTDYFRKRGISDEVVQEFGLGFDPDFQSGDETWQVVVIPYNDYSYMVRNIYSTGNDDRIKKRGQTQIFNLQALNQAERIFIVEGEFDALSLETLGYRAISLGGASNVGKLIAYLKEHPLEGRSFCLLPDNDEAGQGARATLEMELDLLEIPHVTVNISAPYKDVNEALCKDSSSLIYRLEHLDELLEKEFSAPIKENLGGNEILDANSLLSLNINSNVHSFCGKAIALRRTLSFILDTGVTNILFIGAQDEWKISCSLVNRELDNNNQAFSKALFSKLQDKEKLIADIELSLEALSIQYNAPFIPVISLFSFTQQEAKDILNNLNKLSLSINKPILILCPPSWMEDCESLCWQNLNVSVDERGDLLFDGISVNASPINFRLSIRDF